MATNNSVDFTRRQVSYNICGCTPTQVAMLVTAVATAASKDKALPRILAQFTAEQGTYLSVGPLGGLSIEPYDLAYSRKIATGQWLNALAEPSHPVDFAETMVVYDTTGATRREIQTLVDRLVLAGANEQDESAEQVVRYALQTNHPLIYVTSLQSMHTYAYRSEIHNATVIHRYSTWAAALEQSTPNPVAEPAPSESVTAEDMFSTRSTSFVIDGTTEDEVRALFDALVAHGADPAIGEDLQQVLTRHEKGLSYLDHTTRGGVFTTSVPYHRAFSLEEWLPLVHQPEQPQQYKARGKLLDFMGMKVSSCVSVLQELIDRGEIQCDLITAIDQVTDTRCVTIDRTGSMCSVPVHYKTSTSLPVVSAGTVLSSGFHYQLDDDMTISQIKAVRDAINAEAQEQTTLAKVGHAALLGKALGVNEEGKIVRQAVGQLRTLD